MAINKPSTNIAQHIRGRKRLLCMLISLLSSPGLMAAPENGRVIAGEATLSQHGNETQINQHSQHVQIDYDSFDVGRGERVRFNQPNAQSVALNRVTGNKASKIFGNIDANGQVFLINQNGVLFAPGANINVGSLGVSSLGLEHFDVHSGRIELKTHNHAGAINNQGQINSQGDYAYVSFIGPDISNSGKISSDGALKLLADQSHVVHVNNQLIGLQSSQLSANIQNRGQLEAAKVLLSASNVNSLTNSVINNEGVIHATTLKEVDGELMLVAQGSDVFNSGTLQADGQGQQSIHIEAKRLANTGDIHADSAQGSGGHIDVSSSETLVLTKDARITANAQGNGDGGSIRFFSDQNTLFEHGARIEARSGIRSGDGGFVEVSGLEHVSALGLADVRSLNAQGQDGLYYIDPTDILITDSLGSGGSFTTGDPISWNPSGASSVIHVDTINTQLGLGNVEIDTASAFGGNGDITINAPIDINGAGNNSLTLTATRDLVFANTGLGGSISDSNKSSTESSNINLVAGRDITMQIGTNIDIDQSHLNMLASNGDITLPNSGFISVGDISVEANSIRSQSQPHVLFASSVAGSRLTYRANAPSGSMDIDLNNNIHELDLQIDATSTRVITLRPDTDLRIIDINAAQTNLLVNSAHSVGIDALSALDTFRLILPTGIATLPSTGISVSSDLVINSEDIIDTDTGLNARDIILDADFASIKFANPSSDSTVNSTFNSARFEYVGNGDLTIKQTGDLLIIDRLANTQSINVANGNLNLFVNGNLTLQDLILARDLDADGVRKGLIDIIVTDGDIHIGDATSARPTRIQSISPDANSLGGLGNSPSNQVAVRISNRPSSSSGFDVHIGNGTDLAQVHALGGDILLESVGDLNIQNNASIAAYNTAAGSTGGTIDDNSTTTAVGSLTAETGRHVSAQEQVAPGPMPTPIPSPASSALPTVTASSEPTVEQPLVVEPSVFLPATPTQEEEEQDNRRNAEDIIKEELALSPEHILATNADTVTATPKKQANDLSRALELSSSNCHSETSAQSKPECKQQQALKQFLGLMWIGGDLPELDD
ncbi:filamentous hemagglutinin N-terminal domain-containing protein [Agaribacterium sp. ZY112]|uniref:two-partner secretion domain-containing protein n=1 Tax=Agaribacterium sp. ZY112 TaxID=3233574 RepID=UPI0035238589